MSDTIWNHTTSYFGVHLIAYNRKKERKKDNLGVATGMNCGLASFQVAFDIK